MTIDYCEKKQEIQHNLTLYNRRSFRVTPIIVDSKGRRKSVPSFFLIMEKYHERRIPYQNMLAVESSGMLGVKIIFPKFLDIYIRHSESTIRIFAQ